MTLEVPITPGDPLGGKSQAATNRTNSAWGIVEYAAQALSLLCLTPLLLDRLGDDAFGLLVIGTTIMGLNGMFSLGLGPATQHFVAKYRQGNAEEVSLRLKSIVETSIVANAVFGLCSGLVIFFFASMAPWFFKEPPEGTSELLISIIKIAGVALPFVFIVNTVDNTLRGFERFDLTVPLTATTRITAAVAQIVLVLLGFQILALVMAAVICQILQAIVGMIVLRRLVMPGLSRIPSFEYSEFKRFVTYGIYVWLNSMLGTARNSGEVLILASILGPTALTLYAIPSRILAQVHLLLAKAFAYLFPFATKLIHEGNTKKVHEIYLSGTRYLSTLAAVSIPALAIGCAPLLAAWIGVDRAEAITPVFQLLAIRFAVYPLSILTSNLLMAADKTRVMTIVMTINALTILPASALAAYYYGVIGAAAAQLLVFAPILFNRFYVEKNLFGSASFHTVVLPVILIVVPLVCSLLLIRLPVDYPLLLTVIVSAMVGLVCGSICWVFGSRFKLLQLPAPA